MNYDKLTDGFKEGYDMYVFEGNPNWHAWNGKNGYTEGKWLAQNKE